MSALSKLHIPVESFSESNDRVLARSRRQNYYQNPKTTSKETVTNPPKNIPIDSSSKSLEQTQNRVKNRQARSSQLQELPANLKILSVVQKCSFGITLLSVAASVGLYAIDVRTPQNWSQQYKNLETLQRQERQLIEINETLKYQLAREASEQQKTDVNNSLKLDNVAVFVPAATVIEHRVEDEAAENLGLFKRVSLGY
jgi:hypothetical protein